MHCGGVRQDRFMGRLRFWFVLEWRGPTDRPTSTTATTRPKASPPQRAYRTYRAWGFAPVNRFSATENWHRSPVHILVPWA
jgi:hypothetical protein